MCPPPPPSPLLRILCRYRCCQSHLYHWTITYLTWATNPCIFVMSTAGCYFAIIMQAWQKSTLIAKTCNFIQKDRPISFSKAGPSAGYSTWWESKQVQVDYSFLDTIITLFITKWWISQLSADHLSIIVIPGVITNSAPLSSWAYLHSTSTRANIHSLNQPEITIVANWCCWTSTKTLLRAVAI